MTILRYYTRAKLQDIREASRKGDWFTAIVLSATEIERFGCERIEDYLTDKKVGRKLAETMIKPLYLTNVADCLLVMGIISEKERSKILEINDQRNNFIHRQRKAKFPYGEEARNRNLNISRITEQALQSIIDYVPTEKQDYSSKTPKESSQFLGSASFLKEGDRCRGPGLNRRQPGLQPGALPG